MSSTIVYPTQRILFSQVDVNKLEKVVKQSDDILLRASAVFPFDFFPDEITIDKNKVSVIHRVFFGSGQMLSIPYDEIGDVIVEAGPIFATLYILHSVPIYPRIEIKYLKKNEGVLLCQAILGLKLAKQQEVDFANVNSDELIEKVIATGKANQTI